MLTYSSPVIIISIISVILLTALLILIALYTISTRKYRNISELLFDKEDEFEKQNQLTNNLYSQCSSLQKALSDTQYQYKNHLDELKPEFYKLYEQLKTVQQQRTNIYSKYKLCTESHSKVATENTILREQIENYREKVKQFQSELEINDGKNEEVLLPIKSELLKATEQISSYKLQNNQLKIKNEELEKNIAQMQSIIIEINDLKAQINEKDLEITQAESYKKKINELETQRHDLAINLDVLSNKLLDIEELQKTADLFKTLKVELDELQLTVRKLRHDNASLKAKGLSLEKPEIKISISESDTLLGILSGLLLKFHAAPELKAAAVADQSGLIVAETGPREYTEGLTGIAASFDTLNYHVHSFIPFGDLKQIIIVDKNDVTVSAFPIEISNESLMIMMLSAGPGPSYKTVGNALSLILNKNSSSDKDEKISNSANIQPINGITF